ncbi:MAG TPA: hypothetical protein VFT23_00965 [Burkholderiales bacterium]|nr:hypothetical protein [Burkholderiales bacterium]
MSKLISAVLAAAFAVATVSPVAFAQEKEKKAPTSKASKAAALDAACKDKKPGDVVKVDGKDVKCPKPKSAPK